MNVVLFLVLSGGKGVYEPLLNFKMSQFLPTVFNRYQ